MDVYWLQQTQMNLPGGVDWLSSRESSRLHEFHFPKRRADWVLGRWTAKLAVASHLRLCRDHETLRSIEIIAAPSGVPEILFAGKLLDVAISLTHSGDVAACALSSSSQALGCDLEQIEPRSDAFIVDYFTAEEQALVRSAPTDCRWRLIALLWSAKESALKALRVGLRLDTRCVHVIVDSGEPNPSHLTRDWLPLHVAYTGGRVFSGWWRESGRFVQTMVGDPAPNAPVELSLPAERGAGVARF